MALKVLHDVEKVVVDVGTVLELVLDGVEVAEGIGDVERPAHLVQGRVDAHGCEVGGGRGGGRLGDDGGHDEGLGRRGREWRTVVRRRGRGVVLARGLFGEINPKKDGS